MKAFKINNEFEIFCRSENTKYGFRHLAELRENGRLHTKAKACYYNRTWERFEYESVISDLLSKAKIMTQDEKIKCLDYLQKEHKEEIDKQFGFIFGIAKLGNILCETQKEKNDWKTRMLKAGLENEGLIMPEDWDRLSEDDKETRLNNVIKEFEK